MAYYFTRHERNEIKHLKHKGKSNQEIAWILGCKSSDVNRAIKEMEKK